MTILFFILAAVSITTALMVVINRNPLYSALYLVVTFFCLAGLFLLLEAYFLAIVQVIVYAGAIMVLFLFVIMLLNLRTEGRMLQVTKPRVLTALLLAGMFAVQVVVMVKAALGSWTATAGEATSIGSTASVGTALFTKYLLPFEIASLLLLVALVGAVLLAKRTLR